MFFKLLVLFVSVPLIEIAILVKLGESLGFWTTMGIVLITGVVGATLAKMEGLRVYNKIQRELQAGQMPSEGLIDGLMILVAGVVLMTPGFFTDAFGLLLLIPWSRAAIKNWLRKKFEGRIQSGGGDSNIHFYHN